MSGISDGDLFIAKNSKCDSLTVSGSNLTVSGIPDGSSFILKTPQRSNALKLTPSGGTLGLSFVSANLATTTGTISQWTLSSPVGTTKVAHIVGVPKANTWYAIKVDGALFNSFKSGPTGEVSFTYDKGFSSKVFTIEETAPPVTPPLVTPRPGVAPLLPPVSITGVGNIHPTLGGQVQRTLESGALAKVVFPPHSVIGTTLIVIEPQNKAEVIKRNPLPKNTQIIGDLVADFKALFGGKEVRKFEKEITMTFTYIDEQVREAKVDEKTLKVYRWDEITKTWKPIKSQIDTLNNTITAFTDHFALFAVMGEIIEKPIEEMTQEEILLKMIEILKELIRLYTQLIQLLKG